MGAPRRRPARACMGCRPPRGDGVGRARTGARDAERLGVGARGQPVDGARARPAADLLGRARDVTVIRLPAILAREAGGRNSFETDAPTLAEALRGLPVADLL